MIKAVIREKRLLGPWGPTRAPNWLHVLAAPFKSGKVEGSRSLNVPNGGEAEATASPMYTPFNCPEKGGRRRPMVQNPLPVCLPLLCL